MAETNGGGTPVAIGGMHRAGTSMIAKALQMGGLHLGPESSFVPPAPDNPGGFYEHAGFVRFGDDLLAACGGAWDHPPELPPMAADDPRVANLRGRANELVEELAAVPSWGWKDPRVSLTARFWMDLIPDLHVVVCVRAPLEVALSLKRRNRNSYAHGLSLWHAYYAELLEAVPADRRLVTHYDAHFRDPEAAILRVLAFAGLPERGVEEAGEARDAELRHHDLDIDLATAGIDPATIELYRRLCEEAGEPIEEAGERASAPARVDHNALEALLSKHEVERRGRQVASLERTRGELEARVAELEAAGAGEALDSIGARLDRLEEGVDEVRYALEERAGWEDVESLRRCRTLVRERVPRAERVLVIAKGDPRWRDLHGRATANFPEDAWGRYPGFPFADSVAATAHLEAQRARGSGYLLVPEASRWWLETYPEFAAHLAGRYEVVADEPDAGVLADVRTRRRSDEAAPRSLPEIVDALSARFGREPAILDCSAVGLDSRLPGRNVFPPPPGESLPYPDASIDVVLVGSETPANGEVPSGAEARRVAGLALVTVESDTAAAVADVELLQPDSTEPPRRVRFVPQAPEPDAAWIEALAEALADEPGVDVVAEPGGWADGLEEGGLVAVIEEGVLPLPGCCAAARRTFATDSAVGAVAVKLLGAYGSIEAAGTTVFADGSWAGIAAGSHKVAAPWHEFMRDACGGSGVMFLNGECMERLATADGSLPPGPPTAWAGSLWATGRHVVYQPDAAAVRAIGEAPAGASADARVAETWSPALSARPARPTVLDGGAWRGLMARDEVAAAWAAPTAR